jgi:serine phosphatase RsbU (regulator of sigma subunit)
VSEIVTLVYLVLDLDSGMVQFANAGHPPPLVVGLEGQASFLEEGLGSPLGCDDPGLPAEASFRLVPDSTLLLYTDGLVEKRGVSIDEGLERLATVATDGGQDLEAFCEQLLCSMVEGDTADDVALLAIRPVPLQVAHSYVCPQNRVCSRRCARPCVAGFGRATPTHTSRMTSSSPAVRCART